ncbi:MAG: aspartyl protease family protein [Candidatus Eremiobacteraeota bacterium]|nr:aspartyl protease family protein [Candidatus Eremiobacteraeota bacterium]
MGFAGRLLALSTLAVFLVGATPVMPLRDFVQHMRAASGQPYRYHIVSMSRDRSDDVAITRTDLFGLSFLTRVCKNTVCTGTYFDGYRLYAVNLNDTALPNSITTERFVRATRTVNSGTFLAPDFERKGGALVDFGNVAEGKYTYRSIGITSTDMTPVVVWVDPATYLVFAVRDWQGHVLFVDNDYRRVGPLLLPFTIYQNGTVSQRYLSRGIVSAPFDAPRGVAPRFPPTSSAVPMLDAGDTPVIPCTIGSVTLRCLLDTGNSGLSVSLEVADLQHFPVVGEYEVRGLGRYATEVVRAGPLTVGGVQFPTANYVVLHDIHRFRYDAILGADVLAHATVAIDYGERTVQFNAEPTSQPASVVPLYFFNFVPVVPVRLGSTPAALAIDTGDESTINLSYDYYSQHPDLFSATATQTVSGVGGSGEELIGEIAQVQVGDFRVESLQIGATKSLHATAQGHLGGGFLSHFRVILEYARERLGLMPRAGDTAVKSK